jgi:hypothetical protein
MVHHETAAHITAGSHSEPAVNSDATGAAAGNSHSSISNGHAHTSGSSSSGKLPWRVRVEKKLQVTRQLQVLEHASFFIFFDIIRAVSCASPLL